MTNITINIDHRNKLGAARDQNPRPTCVAFAMSDAHTAIRGDKIALSSEYLFYHASLIGKTSLTSGVRIDAACEAIERNGQPQEIAWPYNNIAPHLLGRRWGPPNALGPIFRRRTSSILCECQSIRQSLSIGKPAFIGMYLTPSFYHPSSDGIISAIPGEQTMYSAKHAVLCVASGAINKEPALLIRNSWGTAWGLGGHAWILENHLEPLIFSTLLMMEEPNVSSSTPTS